MTEKEKYKLAVAVAPQRFKNVSLYLSAIMAILYIAAIIFLFFGWFILTPLFNLALLLCSSLFCYIFNHSSKAFDGSLETLVDQYIRNKELYRELLLEYSNEDKKNDMSNWYDKIDIIFK
jgi:hypothetical protein